MARAITSLMPFNKPAEYNPMKENSYNVINHVLHSNNPNTQSSAEVEVPAAIPLTMKDITLDEFLNLIAPYADEINNEAELSFLPEFTESIENAPLQSHAVAIPCEEETFTLLNVSKKRKHEDASNTNDNLNNNNNNQPTVESPTKKTSVTLPYINPLWQQQPVKKYTLSPDSYFDMGTSRLVPGGVKVYQIRHKTSVQSYVKTTNEMGSDCYVRVRNGQTMRKQRFQRPNGDFIQNNFHEILYVEHPTDGFYFEWRGEKLQPQKSELCYDAKSKADMKKLKEDAGFIKVTAQVKLYDPETSFRRKGEYSMK